MRDAPFDVERLRGLLGPAGAARRVEFSPETGSTNDDARALALAGAPHGTVVLTDWQRHGRGRRGAAWVSPARRNLIVSVVLRPALPPERWARLTQACALAGCDALDAVPGLAAPARIKWPNDLWLAGAKVAGILLESTLDGRSGFAVAGMGVNLNLQPDDFPAELRGQATSVWMECGGRPVEREVFAAGFLRALDRRAAACADDFPALLDAVRARSLLTGRRISLTRNGTALTGTVEDLGPEGELLLRHEDGRLEPVSTADLVRPLDD